MHEEIYSGRLFGGILRKPFNIVIIVANTPTIQNTEIDKFYSTLVNAKTRCKSPEIIIMRDLNVKMEKERDGETSGKYRENGFTRQ